MTQEVPKRPTADEPIKLLLDGNMRFVSGQLTHPNHCEESRQALANGQEPIATILACADSRVPPVDIFDMGLGDLFVVRVAGNVIGDHTLGSIEYSVEHLHTPLVVVLGHSSCGAVSAVANGANLEGHMASLGPAIQAAVKKVKDMPGDLTDNAAKDLAQTMSDKIAESEPIIADHVKDGSVKVIPAYYDLESGEVSLL